MKTLKETKSSMRAEYYRFCQTMWYDRKQQSVKLEFIEYFIEHMIKCFGSLDNDYFKVKDTKAIKEEIIEILS